MSERSTNREMLVRIANEAAKIGKSIIEDDLSVYSFSSLNLKKWDEYAGSIRELGEVLDLLYLITCIKYDDALNELPPLSNFAIMSHQTSGGNRCYFQRNEIERWYGMTEDEEKENNRFDLDWV